MEIKRGIRSTFTNTDDNYSKKVSDNFLRVYQWFGAIGGEISIKCCKQQANVPGILLMAKICNLYSTVLKPDETFQVQEDQQKWLTG